MYNPNPREYLHPPTFIHPPPLFIRWWMRSCLVHLGHGTPPRTGSTARTQGFHHKQVPQTPSLVVAAESRLPKTVMRHTVKGCNNIHNNNNNTTNTAAVAVHRDAVGTM